jgi:putative FmdB family regulatory protein
MPIYEFRCRECDERLELRHSICDLDAPASCPMGHDDAVRLLPVFAAIGSARSPSPVGGSGAGCCVGVCGSA